jgi:hypothetical protein
MLFSIQSNKLVKGSTIFFKWNKGVYAYGILEKVILNNKNDLVILRNKIRNNKVYPFIIKLPDNSIHVSDSRIPKEEWLKAINRGKPLEENAYLKLSPIQVKPLRKSF